MALRTPPLRAVHADNGARFTEFGGWEMPVTFDSIRTEHASVRESVGKFDVSHMGRIVVAGPDAPALMQRLTTNDVSALDPGDAQYAMITDEQGIILDDTVLYRLPDGTATLLTGENQDRVADTDGPKYLFVPNAGHETAMLDRWRRHRDAGDLDAVVVDATDDSSMLAVQGPDAAELLSAAALAPTTLTDCGRFSSVETTVAGVDCLAARTGYTGEDGFELFCAQADVRELWTALACQSCGLGARDTLRLEMGFLLSGQEFDPESEPRTPYEAGVGATVDLDTQFVGRDTLADIQREGVDETLVGLTLQDRGVPRSSYQITTVEGDPIGHVTSGTMSPTLGDPIALGYLPVERSEPATPVEVVIRGDHKRAVVTELPFLER